MFCQLVIESAFCVFNLSWSASVTLQFLPLSLTMATLYRESLSCLFLIVESGFWQVCDTSPNQLPTGGSSTTCLPDCSGLAGIQLLLADGGGLEAALSAVWHHLHSPGDDGWIALLTLCRGEPSGKVCSSCSFSCDLVGKSLLR